MTHVLVALLTLILFITVPLAANRGEFKRVLLIAICLEIIKCTLVLTSIKLLLNAGNGIVGIIIAVLTIIVMLPELAIGYGHDSTPFWMYVAMFVSGIIWNLIPAFLISICFPDQGGVEDSDGKISSSMEG